jgi:hypothetical protein
METRLPLNELINNQNDPNLLLLLTSKEDSSLVMQKIKESGESVNNLIERLKAYLAQPQAVLELMHKELAPLLWIKISSLQFINLNLNRDEQNKLGIILFSCILAHNFINIGKIAEVINIVKNTMLESYALDPFHKKMLCIFFEDSINASSLPMESKESLIFALKSELNPYSLVADRMQEERTDSPIKRKNEYQFKSKIFPPKKVKEEFNIVFRPPSPSGAPDKLGEDKDKHQKNDDKIRRSFLLMGENKEKEEDAFPIPDFYKQPFPSGGGNV